ncbi:MAG TPA: lysylphosphatidylglycerol synthase transmembrane domain-containing protein [Solirubrobacterales bacterium]|nr:lysylphosphatidylglycerol synthase transmembrane domain-containing protein [Solirubrobacterales bacterium]
MAEPDRPGMRPADGNGRLTEPPQGPTRPDDEAPSLLENPRRVVLTTIVVLLLFAAIYVLLPKLIGLEDAIEKMGEGEWQWFAVAVGFNVLAFGSYVALFRGVIGENLVHLDWRESYQITMAGLAASRVLSAGGAGGVVLSYWALRKAGMRRVEAAQRMVAFLVLLYAFYVLAVIVFGVLLETGVLAGPNPVSMTIIPAAIAGGVAIAFLLFLLIPEDLQRRLSLRGSNWASRAVLKLSQVPATISSGTRLALGFVREPRKGGLAVLGAVGFWASNVGILWATFMAFGVALPIGILVLGFFVGMAANLAPDPAGVGAVDAGLIGAFVIFGEPAATVIAAVLVYRLIAFWMPLPPGIVAFMQLRRTVARWEAEGRAVEDDERQEAPEPAAISNTSQNEVRYRDSIDVRSHQ